MTELVEWLRANKISFEVIDSEVIEVEDFGRMFFADLSGVKSVFRSGREKVEFNLMEDAGVLMEEGIYYVVFLFGRNWYYYDLREEFEFRPLKYIGRKQRVQRDVPFVNLGVHTGFELLNGSGDVKDWVRKAKYLGHRALGICDRNTMAATLQLQKECGKAGITPVFGYSFALKDEGEKVDMKVYCQSQQGLENLLRIQKEIMVDSVDQTLSLEGLMRYAGGNVLVLGKLSSYWLERNVFLVDELCRVFDRVLYQVDVSEYKADRVDVEVLRATRHFFHTFWLADKGCFLVDPILICDAYYLDREDARNKVLLNKIASGAAHEQSEDQFFKDVDEHYERFAPLFDSTRWDVDELFYQLCWRTVEVADGARAAFETGRMFMPEYRMRKEEKERYGDRRRMFRELLGEGLQRRVAACDLDRYRKRLEEEVYIIESTNNVDYFLIQWDMVQEARRRGIAVGIGRGSAGGSLVSYLLGIISIDPVRYDLLFSRFLVPERCGLNWSDEVTVIGEDRELEPGEAYIEVDTEYGRMCLNKWAKVRVCRGEERLTVYANDLREDDTILMDNRDLLWVLKEIML